MVKCDSKNQQNNVIIVILSGKNFKERRQAQRETWLKNSGLEHCFILGGAEEITQEPDILWVDCKDDELSKKLILAYKYLVKKNFNYIFTCDDDTYVVVDRLLSCGFQEHEYMGTCYTFEEGIREGIGHAEGGAGFFLSRAAIEKITQIPIDHPIIAGPSDTTIGDLTKMYNIKLRDDKRFVQGYSIKKKHGEIPTLLNEKITSHYVSPELMHKIHADFTRLYWQNIMETDQHVRQSMAFHA